MKKKILLITHGFPFGESERGFLSTEFIELLRNFEVTVLAYGDIDSILAEGRTSGKVKVKKSKGFIQKKDPVGSYQWNLYYMQKKSSIKNLIRGFLQPFRPEVWEDIKLARKNCSIFLFFCRVARIILYSLEAEQVQKEIQKIVEKDGIDIIYTYWGTEENIAALRLKKRYKKGKNKKEKNKKEKNIKVITRFHGYDLYTERTSIAWQVMRQFTAEYCDRLIFVCNMGKQYFNQKWGGAEKSIVSYLGTPSMDCVGSKYHDELVIISCSNLIKLKRVDLIMKALGILPKEKNIFWHHLGDGIEGQALYRLAERIFSEKPNIQWKFWGQVQHQEIETIYQKIKPHLFITTSSTEGIPVSVQEAFSMGIPAIGTNVGGMQELIIDGQTGFLLQDNPSIEEIAQAIEKFCNMAEQERLEMGKKAYQLWREKFNAKINAQNFVQILKQI